MYFKNMKLLVTRELQLDPKKQQQRNKNPQNKEIKTSKIKHNWNQTKNKNTILSIMILPLHSVLIIESLVLEGSMKGHVVQLPCNERYIYS